MTIYDHIARIQPKLMLEIGAHHGADTIRFRAMLPDAKIICFEPDPRNLRKLSELEVNRICTIEPYAVSDRTGKSEFYLSNWADGYALDSTEWSASSSIKRPKLHLNIHKWVGFKRTITVDTIRLDDYEPIQGQTIDFIWMDVQGAEDLVFSGATETLKRARYLYTEYSNTELYEGQLNLRNILTRLGSHWQVVETYPDDVLLVNTKC